MTPLTWNPIPGCSPNHYTEPLKTTEPRSFVVTSDLFHADIDRFWINEVFGIMAAARHHTFQLVTGHPDRVRELLDYPGFAHRARHRAEGYGRPVADWVWPLPNVQISPPEPPDALLAQLEAEWQKTQIAAPDRDRRLDPLLDEALIAACERAGVPRDRAERMVAESRRRLEARWADDT